MVTQFAWTPDAVDTLRRLASGRRSAAAIAAELGCSRNAVIGKASRLGVALGSFAGPVRLEARERLDAAEVMLLDEIMAMPVAVGVRVHELRLSHCRWVDDPAPPWVFCGKPAERGSYCAAHAARVYTRTKP